MTTMEISHQYSLYKRRLLAKQSAIGISDAPAPGFLDSFASAATPDEREVAKTLVVLRDIFPDPNPKKDDKEKKGKEEKEKSSSGVASGMVVGAAVGVDGSKQQKEKEKEKKIVVGAIVNGVEGKTSSFPPSPSI